MLAIAMPAISVALQSGKHASLVKCLQGKHVSMMETCIPSDMCVGKHTSLGMCVCGTHYTWGNMHHYDASPDMLSACTRNNDWQVRTCYYIALCTISNSAQK